MNRRRRKGRMSSPYVKRLTFEQRQEIPEVIKMGASIAWLARQYGVSESAIRYHLPKTSAGQNER